MRKNQRKITILLLLLMLLVWGCGDKENVEQVRIGSLKGPTSIGLVSLMTENDNLGVEAPYIFEMETQPDVLLTKMMQGELDIALVPANVAAVLYQKSEGGICVIDINTLGVLYLVSEDNSITNISDLKGKKIYLTGKGTTPDYVLQYLLNANDISLDDVQLEYKSEATEVAAIITEDPSAVGLLPQPFAIAATQQNTSLSMVVDLTNEWDDIQSDDGSMLVTGVTVVRREFLEEHEAEVTQFMEDHQNSVAMAGTDASSVAAGMVQYGIMEKESVAKLSIPYCNITYIDGENMRNALSGYLNVLYTADPASVGGVLPGDDFYYIQE